MKTITDATVVAKPDATITSNNTNVSDGDTVEIGSITYTFKDTIASSGHVHIGADADASLLNLISAINHTGTAGTDYANTGVTSVVHPEVSAASSVTSHSFKVTSKLSGVGDARYAVDTTAATLSWDNDYLTVKEISATFTVEDQTFTAPGVQVTVPEYPSGNGQWSRAVRATDEALFCMRYGAGIDNLAMLLNVWSALAYEACPTLSWAPRFSTNPPNDTTASGAASFTAVVNATDEIAPYQYKWFRSADSGDNWTEITGATTPADGSITYSGYTTLTLSIASAAAGQDGYQYKCRAISVAGTTDSSSAILTFGT